MCSIKEMYLALLDYVKLQLLKMFTGPNTDVVEI